MWKQITHVLVGVSAIILLMECSWFQKEVVDETLIKPVPVGGYEALSTRIYYPRELREQGIEGTIGIRAHISKDGDVIETIVGKSLHPDLNRIVTNAVKRTHFTPASRGGTPVDIWIDIPFVFALQDWQDRPTPFSRFEIIVHPDPAYQRFQVELKGRLVVDQTLPVRFECLLPVNYNNPWVKTGRGMIPQTGLVRDDQGEWLVFELNERDVDFGFQYLPISEQDNSKLQYRFALNQKLPKWTLSVVYDDQAVVFQKEPDRILEDGPGGRRIEYDLQRLDAYEPRYLEIGLEK